MEESKTIMVTKIDLSEIESIAAGDEDTFYVLIKKLKKHLNQEIQAIEEGIKVENLKAIADAFHTNRVKLSLLGQEKLLDEVKDWEETYKGGEYETDDLLKRSITILMNLKSVYKLLT